MWNTCSPYHCNFHRELLYLLHSNALMSGTTVYSLSRRLNAARFQCSYKAKWTLAHYGWQKINSFTAKSAHHSTQQSGADRFPMPSVCKHRRTRSFTRTRTLASEQAIKCNWPQAALWNSTDVELTTLISDVITPPTFKRSHAVIMKQFKCHFYWFLRAVTNTTQSWPFHHPVHTHLSMCAGWRGGGVHMAAFTHWHTLH